MYKATFGQDHQISFKTESEFYEFLGFLTKNDGTTKLVWEPNDQSGAWGKEGRIHFFSTQPVGLRVKLSLTAGVGSVNSRVNCNEFIENIRDNHGFVLGETQDIARVRNTVPSEHINDFNNGRQL